MTSSYRHVALMGPPGVGKTTFIKKVVDRLQEGGLTCQGFYTEEVRREGSRTGFDVVTLEGQRGILSRVRPAVLVLDEVGKMEMFSEDFVKGVRQAISSPSSTILATIPIPKGKPIPLVEEIRRNHSFLVVHLTRSNRDDPTLQEKIMNILRASLKI
ncbi:Cancer-related nucleoside-triphosphatase [Portunus trituberculatus]|uniref:Cancer-related nucleoside-triphosphatase n=1 Tax=Portunus trituberculatus TaxID=210409 RepID=A0A5B7DHL4_PORTR|nr:Cancer-related nucleoside-triphosphatase [Portunus trituberculatus]